MTIEKNLADYCQNAMACGASNAMVIQAKQIITEPWVRLKCQFGCVCYGKNYCCPPYTPTPQQTRLLLDSYDRAILFQLQWTKDKQGGRIIAEYFEIILAMEIEMFFEGFYRAFSMLAGPCILCRHFEEGCGLMNNESCRFPSKARPSMEGCGIDVYQTVHQYGLPLKTLRTEAETRNMYCIILVD